MLSDLIHALKQDADERDQHFDERLDRLQKHVLALSRRRIHAGARPNRMWPLFIF